MRIKIRGGTADHGGPSLCLTCRFATVVKGQRLQTVSDTLQFTYSALRKWVHRFAHQGTQGLVDRPRPGRPPKITGELEKHLNRLVDQDPLQHGSVSSQWSCRELATVLTQQTGVQLGRESVRCT